MNKTFARSAVAVAVLSVFGAANAVGPDFTSLTAAVDFSTVGTAILAVAALKVIPLVVSWGSRKVMGAIGR